MSAMDKIKSAFIPHHVPEDQKQQESTEGPTTGTSTTTGASATTGTSTTTDKSVTTGTEVPTATTGTEHPTMSLPDEESSTVSIKSGVRGAGYAFGGITRPNPDPVGGTIHQPHQSHLAADHEHGSERKGSSGSAFGALHADDQMGPFHNDGDTQHTAKEKYYGVQAAHAQDNKPADYVPGNMFMPGHKKEEPSVADKTGATEPAHHTFVKPGYNHEHHIGVDGKIGRESEISGYQGADARRTSAANEITAGGDSNFVPAPHEPTLEERQRQAPAGTVIEPRTGLPMNVEKFGTGYGGTDGSAHITGYDKAVFDERRASADATNEGRRSSTTWEGVKDANQ